MASSRMLHRMSLVTLMMKELSSSETSVLTRTTQHNIPQDTILHSYRCENLKSYLNYSCFFSCYCLDFVYKEGLLPVQYTFFKELV
jgi:hypothetical protein